jgi:hypothetical protein
MRLLFLRKCLASSVCFNLLCLNRLAESICAIDTKVSISRRTHIFLALSLFMLGIFADYHDFTMALNDFAFFANRFDRRFNFHR